MIFYIFYPLIWKYLERVDFWHVLFLCLISHRMMYKSFIYENFDFWVTVAVPMWPNAKISKNWTTPNNKRMIFDIPRHPQNSFWSQIKGTLKCILKCSKLPGYFCHRFVIASFLLCFFYKLLFVFLILLWVIASPLHW